MGLKATYGRRPPLYPTGLPNHLWQASLRDRFEHQYHPDPTSGCWLWTGRIHPNTGYGVIMVDGRKDRAHRVSWRLHRGPIQDGSWVLHKCDTPPCVNPGHLYLGTPADNIRDRDSRNRTARGARHGGYKKLDTEAVAAIRASAEDVDVLASQHGVSRATIYRVRKGDTWAWL